MGTIRKMRYVAPSATSSRPLHEVGCPKENGAPVFVQTLSKRRKTSDTSTCHGCASFIRQGGMFIECGVQDG